MPNGNGELTVHDLPLRERVKAYLPATTLLLAIVSLMAVVVLIYTQQQRDHDRRAFERKTDALTRRLAVAQVKAEHAQATAELARALSNARFAYSINKLTCVLRDVSQQTIHRLEVTKAPGYKQAEAFWRRLLTANVPIPALASTCRNLPAEPPPDTLPPSG